MNALLMTEMQAGLFVFILGLLIVFFGIAVIVIVISALGKIMKAQSETTAVETTAVETAAATVQAAPAQAEEDLTPEKVAAITAVLTAYFMAEGKSPCEFRIRKIKRL